MCRLQALEDGTENVHDHTGVERRHLLSLPPPSFETVLESMVQEGDSTFCVTLMPNIKILEDDNSLWSATGENRLRTDNLHSNMSVCVSSDLLVKDLHVLVLKFFRISAKTRLEMSFEGRILHDGDLSLREIHTYSNCTILINTHSLPGGMDDNHHKRLCQLHSEVEFLEKILDEACRNWGAQLTPQTRSEGRSAGFVSNSDLPFTEDDDDQEVIFGLFQDLDMDDSNSISIAELRAAIRKYSIGGNSQLCSVFEDLMDKYACIKDGNAQISFDDFSDVFCKLPRVKGERVKWAATLGLDGLLARLLVKGDPFDGLKGLRNLDGTALDLHVHEVCQRFSSALPGILRKGLSKLKCTGQLQTSLQDHINSKFVLDGAYLGRFATMDDFYRGPEALIGVPNPRIREGAEKEHCLRPNAMRKFTTSNYNLTTWPQLEWEFVVCPVDDAPDYRRYPHTPMDKKHWMLGNEWRGAHGRDIITLSTLMEVPNVKLQVSKANLLLEEVICLRLYTGWFAAVRAPLSSVFGDADHGGADLSLQLKSIRRLAYRLTMQVSSWAGPMFMLYNAALRDFPSWDVEHLMGNKYETTIFVIASGITKLSKVPHNGSSLYRLMIFCSY
jgi:hypothetical protein